MIHRGISMRAWGLATVVLSVCLLTFMAHADVTQNLYPSGGTGWGPNIYLANSSETLGFRFHANQVFTRITLDSVFTYTGGAGQGCNLTLYQFNTNWATSIAGIQLEGPLEIRNHPDNGAMVFNLSSIRAAGDYLLVMDQKYGSCTGIGPWTWTNGNTSDNTWLYKNGAEQYGLDTPAYITKFTPTAPSALDLATADDTGSSNTDNLTKNTTGLTINGTGAEAGSTVRIKEGASVLATGAAAAFNPGGAGIDIALGAGSHAITATVVDAAGNESGTSSSLTIVVETSQPTVTLSSSAGAYVTTPAGAITVNIVLSEAVTDLALGSISVTNAVASSLTSSDSTHYNFTLTPSTEGLFSCSLAANGIHDAAGNGNTASNTVSCTWDKTQPTAPGVSGTTPTNNPRPTWSWTPGGGGNGTYRWD